MSRIWTIVIVFVGAGCAGAGSGNLPVSASQNAPPMLPHAAPADIASQAAPVDDPPAVLTLRDAIVLALVRNPELSAYALQVRADEARMIQAGLRPNPEGSVYGENFAGTGRFNGGRDAQITLELSQAIELGGKRAARVEAATRLRDLANREYEVKRVAVLADVTSRFIGLLAAQSFLGVAKANLALGEETLEAAARRARAGAGLALDERKARIEVARSRILVEHAEHEVLSLRRELAATWGSSTPTFDRVAGDLYRRRRVPPFADLVDELEAAPEIVRDMAEKQLREAEVRLADAYRVPTPNVLVGFRRLQANQDETMTAGIFMPLPFSDRNQGNRSAARALLEKSKDTLQATDIRLRTALFKLYQELLHASAALDSLENEILTQAEASLALSRSGFLEGRFTYLDLADAERTLVALKRERIETAASYHQFVLDIERLTGQPLDDTTDKAVLP